MKKQLSLIAAAALAAALTLAAPAAEYPIAQQPRLCALAAQFTADPQAFGQRYDRDELFARGAGRRFASDVTEWHTWMDILPIRRAQESPVVGNIQIGSPVSALAERWGTPHYQCEELALTGYRFGDFAIVAKGSETVEELAVICDALPQEYGHILERFERSAEPAGSFARRLSQSLPHWMVNDLYDANTLVYSNGIAFDTQAGVAHVWKNYPGPTLTGAGNGRIVRHGTDLAFELAEDYYRDEARQLARAGADSPDGRWTALAQNAAQPGNGDWLQLRCNDGSAPDRSVGALNAAGNVQWLGTRYFVYDVQLHESCLYDLETGENRTLREAADLAVRSESTRYATTTESLPGDRLAWSDDEGNRFTLAYAFEADGTIRFTNFTSFPG